MEGVDPGCAIILKAGILSESAVKIGDATFAFIKDRAAEKRVPFNVEHNFRQTFGLLEKLVRLEPSDGGEAIKRIGFRDCDDVIWNRIDPEFALIKILHHERVA